MVVDPRHDHSFRIPRPDLSAAIGVPNACNQCHQDRSAEWASEAITRIHAQPKPGLQTFGEAFAAADRGDPRGAAALSCNRGRSSTIRHRARFGAGPTFAPTGSCRHRYRRRRAHRSEPAGARRGAIRCSSACHHSSGATRCRFSTIRSARCGSPQQTSWRRSRRMRWAIMQRRSSARRLSTLPPSASIPTGPKTARTSETSWQNAAMPQPRKPRTARRFRSTRTSCRPGSILPICSACTATKPERRRRCAQLSKRLRATPTFAMPWDCRWCASNAAPKPCASWLARHRQRPTTRDMPTSIAVALHSFGRAQEAIDELERGLATAPDNRDILEALAQFLSETGDERRAAEIRVRLQQLDQRGSPQ